MEAKAVVWYQDATKSSLFMSWEAFFIAMFIRFSPTSYDDPIEALTKIKQTTTISVYKAQFEALSDRLRGLYNNHLAIFLVG